MINIHNIRTLKSDYPDRFQFVRIADQDRITNESFYNWFSGQTLYRHARSCEYHKKYYAEKVGMMPHLWSTEDINSILHKSGSYANSFVTQNAPSLDIVFVGSKRYVTKDSFKALIKNGGVDLEISDIPTDIEANGTDSEMSDIPTDTTVPEQSCNKETAEQSENCTENTCKEEIAPILTTDCNYYTVNDLQGILGMGRNSVIKLINSNIFRVIRTGRKFRIPKDDFNAWLLLQAQNYEEDDYGKYSATR